MDLHLKQLFTKYNTHFANGPGYGLGSGTCLAKIPGIAPVLIESMYRAMGALFRTNPWLKLRSSHLFGVKVGKNMEWTNNDQLFKCAQFIGGLDGGDLGFHLYRSVDDARKSIGCNETVRLANVEVLRVVYVEEAVLSGSNVRMVEALGVEKVGGDRYSLVDVVMCREKGGLGFRNPTIEELRYLYGFMKGFGTLHPLLEADKESGKKGARWVKFESFIETVDVEWPVEMVEGFDVVAVTITYPPGNNIYKNKISRDRSPTPNKYSGSPKEEETSFGSFDAFVSRGGRKRKCAMCEDEMNDEECLTCGRCHGVVYCGEICKRNHWKESHRDMCGLYRAMMEKGEELSIEMNFFKFPCFTENLCKWLEDLRIHRTGMWRRMCNCYSHSPFGMLPVALFSDPWGGLREGEYPCDSPISGSSHIILLGWSDYYDLRYLSLSSPVASILSYPLTLYHILMTLNIRSKSHLLDGKEVVVHYLGPEGELDWIPAFVEIGHLLDGLGYLKIFMIGPEVSANLSGTVLQISSRVEVNFFSGIYQEEIIYLPLPNVVVALNCGLESYASWRGALDFIKSMDVSAFFTEESEILCTNIQQVLRDAKLHISLPVTPNPFRSPLSYNRSSNNVPSYKNGFLFGVNTWE